MRRGGGQRLGYLLRTAQLVLRIQTLVALTIAGKPGTWSRFPGRGNPASKVLPHGVAVSSAGAPGCEGLGGEAKRASKAGAKSTVSRMGWAAGPPPPPTLRDRPGQRVSARATLSPTPTRGYCPCLGASQWVEAREAAERPAVASPQERIIWPQKSTGPCLRN